MAESEAFLKAIGNNPDEDGPRLIYADWLEDNGDPQRAEFIRVQCALEGLKESDRRFIDLWDRENKLLKANWVEWITPICEILDEPIPIKVIPKPFWHPNRWFWNPPDQIVGDSGYSHFNIRIAVFGRRSHWISRLSETPYFDEWKFHRGFIESLSFTISRPETFQQIRDCWSITPLTTLGLYDSHVDTIPQLVQQEQFLQIRKLTIRLIGIQSLEALVNSPNVGGLRELDLGSLRFSNPKLLIQAISQPRYFTNLRKLSFGGYSLSAHELATILESPLIERLEELSIGRMNIGENIASIISGSVGFQNSRCILGLYGDVDEAIYSSLKAQYGDRFQSDPDLMEGVDF